MSLASSPDCLLQVEDKEFRMLFPSVKDPTSNEFDEYLNGDLYDRSDQSSNKDLFGNLQDFLDRRASVGDDGIPTSVSVPKEDAASPQPWRKGLWCLNQNLAAMPEITVEKTRGNAQRTQYIPRTQYADAHNIDLFSHRSPPTTPSHNRTKKVTSSPTAARNSTRLQVPHTLSREPTLSPSPMYAQLQHGGDTSYPDAWQQDFQSFHLQAASQNLPLSPPLSGRLPTNEVLFQPINAATGTPNLAAAGRYPFQHHVSQMALPAVTQPSAFEAPLFDPTYLPRNEFQMEQEHHANPSAALAPSYLAHGSQAIPVWISETLESSDESARSYDTQTDSSDSRHGQTWWSPPAPVAQHQQPQYVQESCYPALVAPTPQRSAHQLLQQPLHVATNGLGIQYPDTCPPMPPPPLQQAAIVSPCGPPYVPNANAMSAYPPRSPAQYTFDDASPFTTPRRRRRSLTLRSPSPSVSPKHTGREMRQRSPTRPEYTHNRRKSIHKSGPMKDSTPAAKPPRTPRTPKTPTGGFAVMEFKNLTPKDSAKLLSDVAPSGSSKTRARREAEAREKRKRLSEAAVKAVRRAATGDLDAVEALERAILT